eukprot:Gb_02329 [translate_table: standard]
MGSRFPSHQLSNGLYVSGRPEQLKERQPTMTSKAMPYTGGDIKKSGELGKMFDIPVVDTSKTKKSGPGSSSGPLRTGSFGAPTAGSDSGPLPSNAAARSGPQRSNSGPLTRNTDSIKKTSGPLSGGGTPVVRHNSGPQPPSLPATGLITSGPISSGPLNSSGAPRKISGPLDSAQSGNKLNHSISLANSQAVTNLSHDQEYSFRRNIPKVILWTVIPLFVMGFIAGGFILAAVQNPILLIVVVCLFGAVALLMGWNACWGSRAVTGFLASYPDAELRSATDGQYVKVTGVVTCGSVPLESSYQKVSRCVYISTGLYEYRGWNAKPANPKHRRFTWGLRYLERHVADFYISDFQSGLRALVKAGYGAKVTSYVDAATVVDLTEKNRDLSPDFVRWLGERNLSSDDRVMRLKEGYIKEGSTVSVMGVVQRHDNVLMIVPSQEPVSTGCQWRKSLLPASLEGIVLRCDDTSRADVIPV